MEKKHRQNYTNNSICIQRGHICQQTHSHKPPNQKTDKRKAQIGTKKEQTEKKRRKKHNPTPNNMQQDQYTDKRNKENK